MERRLWLLVCGLSVDTALTQEINCSSHSAPLPAVLLAEHAAWSGEEEHALLAAEWCRESFGAQGAGRHGSLQAAAQAQLHTARVLSGADRPLPQPRARY